MIGITIGLACMPMAKADCPFPEVDWDLPTDREFQPSYAVELRPFQPGQQGKWRLVAPVIDI